MSKNGKKNTGASKGFLRLFTAVLALAFLVYVAIAGLGFEQSGSASDIKLGLDLAGGVSITYQTVDENPSATDMADTIYKLQLRAQTYSNEAEVYQEGTNRINVDIPDVTDANEILEDLGKPGSLNFLDPDGNVVLTGADVAGADAGIVDLKGNGSKDYVVNLVFNDDAAKKFAELTEANVGKVISIQYDGEIVSAPTVDEPITGGKCYIKGQKDYEEAERLASTIRIGSLKLELNEIRSNVVGAKLGSDAIESGLKAGAVGLVLVMIFMIAFKITLTLPGIAGIVLTIGMAVDANVIIFSRMREELAAGKSVRIARKEGFNKALSAILDGNVTTLIAALVLYLMGSGTVKGFATTLALGTVLSMFTALVVTRFILTGFYEIGVKDAKFYGKKAAIRVPSNINFIGLKKPVFAIAAVIILLGFGSMAFHGPVKGGNILNYSLEFLGGTSTSVKFNENMDMDTLNKDVVPMISEVTGDNDIQVQTVTGSNEVIFKTRTLNTEERQALEDKLIETYSIDKEAIKEESISAVVSKEMKQDAISAVLLATVLMLLYIWFRFKDLRIAGSTILALIHDVLVTLTCYAVFRWTVGNTFIACMLTVVGYSVNDTIVVFDRIRENMKNKARREDISDVINRSMSQVLSRCMSTSITTGIMVLVLLIFGVASIREFAMPLLMGVIAGTFSSVFLAGNFWHTMKSAQKEQQ